MSTPSTTTISSRGVKQSHSSSANAINNTNTHQQHGLNKKKPTDLVADAVRTSSVEYGGAAAPPFSKLRYRGNLTNTTGRDAAAAAGDAPHAAVERNKKGSSTTADVDGKGVGEGGGAEGPDGGYLLVVIDAMRDHSLFTVDRNALLDNIPSPVPHMPCRSATPTDGTTTATTTTAQLSASANSNTSSNASSYNSANAIADDITNTAVISNDSITVDPRSGCPRDWLFAGTTLFPSAFAKILSAEVEDESFKSCGNLVPLLVDCLMPTPTKRRGKGKRNSRNNSGGGGLVRDISKNIDVTTPTPTSVTDDEPDDENHTREKRDIMSRLAQTDHTFFFNLLTTDPFTANRLRRDSIVLRRDVAREEMAAIRRRQFIDSRVHKARKMSRDGCVSKTNKQKE